MMRILAVLAASAALIPARPIVDADVLEPSVQNEVEHALSAASTNSPPVSASVAAAVFGEGGVFCTNSLARTDIAIKLVSAQKSDGRWLSGTNDVTAAVVDLLESFGCDFPR